MKKIFLLLILLCIEKALHAQYVYTIKADSVKITNSCDTAELIIENHTQTVPGFLYNKGRGRTEFRRVAQLDDTSVVIGGDTIHLGRGNKHFANADLTFDGDHLHNGAFHSVKLTDFGEIGFKTNTMDGTHFTEMKLDTSEGYDLTVKNTSDEDDVYINSHHMDRESINFNANVSRTNFIRNSEFNLEGYNFNLQTSFYNPETGEGESVGIKGGLPHDGPIRLELYSNDGDMIFHNENSGNGTGIEMNFYKADSLAFHKSGPNGNTRYTQTDDKFVFRRLIGGANNFRILGLPTSSSTTDSMLVIDNNGQVKKRSQSPTRKSATVTGASYTVPADVDVVFVNYTGGTATITLPSGTLDREITIKNLNTTNSVALSGLDSSESNTVATRGAITVKYTGSAWVGISKY